MSDDDRDEFSVVEFYEGGTHSYVWRGITAKEALKLAAICAREALARGAREVDRRIQRIVITDGGDHTVFEWTRGKGITYPEDWEKLTG